VLKLAILFDVCRQCLQYLPGSWVMHSESQVSVSGSLVSSTLIRAVLTGPADSVCHIGTLMQCVEAVA